MAKCDLFGGYIIEIRIQVQTWEFFLYIVITRISGFCVQITTCFHVTPNFKILCMKSILITFLFCFVFLFLFCFDVLFMHCVVFVWVVKNIAVVFSAPCASSVQTLYLIMCTQPFMLVKILINEVQVSGFITQFSFKCQCAAWSIKFQGFTSKWRSQKTDFQ